MIMSKKYTVRAASEGKNDWFDTFLPGSKSVRKSQNSVDGSTRRSLLGMQLSILLVLIFSVIGFRAVTLQLTTGDNYRTAARENRIREKINFAERGRILDRNGTVLAENVPGYQLSVLPYLLEENDELRNEDYQKIAAILEIDLEEVQDSSEREGREHVLPLLIAADVDEQKALELEQEIHTLPGYSLDVTPRRRYISDAGLAHIIGYVGRVSPDDLTKRTDILPIDFIGRGGVEQHYDEQLRGTNGRHRYEVDALGRPTRSLATIAPQRGKDIVLNIDYDAQVELAKQLEATLKEIGKEHGSAVSVDPMNGEVLAMVSYPYYDNNLFARGISSEEFSALIKDRNQPFLNRVIAGGYPSGSIIKPLVGAAALQEGIVDENTIIQDSGFISVASVFDPSVSYRFNSWKREGLGMMNMRSAIAKSSNIYFYTVAGGYGGITGLGAEKLTDYYKLFGLGSRTGIDLPGEIEGRVPTPAWKKEFFGKNWFIGDTYNIAIGQGDILVSPLQITMANAAIANNGTLFTPRVVRSIDGEGTEAKIIRQLPIDQANITVIREGMNQVTTNGSVCACRFTNVPVSLGAKSGTAETNQLQGTADDERSSHAWFMAFGPFEGPEIMTTTMIEKGDSSVNAIPVVTNFLEKYFTTIRNY